MIFFLRVIQDQGVTYFRFFDRKGGGEKLCSTVGNFYVNWVISRLYMLVRRNEITYPLINFTRRILHKK